MTTPKIRFAGVPSYSDYPSTNRKQKFMKRIFLHIFYLLCEHSEGFDICYVELWHLVINTTI